MFDVQATGSNNIVITGFDQSFRSTGSHSGFALYEYVGGITGHTTSAAGWVLATPPASST